MLEKFAGYKTQIRVLEKKLKEMDHSKLSPAKVKEVTEAIQNLKSLVKEKEDKREERKKKKEEAAKAEPKVEATVQTPEVVKESSPAPTEEVLKEADVNKFAVDSRVEPIRGTPGSVGVVIREAGVNGDPLVYVKWQEGALKTAHGDYGAYYPSDLRLKSEVVAEAKDPTTYVPREQLYNLEADLKSNYERMIVDMQEEIKTAQEKGEYAWVGRLEEKLADIKKTYDEKYNKTAEDENGSGGANKLKVVDLNPPYDKDPQEKSTGYGGDRPMGAMVAPNSDENSLPLESAIKTADEDADERAFERAMDHLDKKLMKGDIHQKEYDTEVEKLKKRIFPKEASLKFADLDLNSIEKRWALYVDGKLAIRTLTRQKAERIAKERFPQQVASGKYEIKREDHVPVEASLAVESTHILKIKSLHDGMAECSEGDWHLATTGSTTKEKIEEEFKHHKNQHKASLQKQAINITVGEKLFVVNPLGKTADNEYQYDVNLANNSKLFKITSKDEMGQEHLAYVIEKELTKEASNKCSICNEEFASWPEYDAHKKEKHGPKMAKLTSNLAFLKKGSFVSILDVDKNKKQVKFASLDNSLRGWAPMQKFAAMDVPSANLVDHEGHKDEVLADNGGREILVTCPANSVNVEWRTVEAPPATPESLNPDVASLDKQARGCDQCEMLSINGVPTHETGCPKAPRKCRHGKMSDVCSVCSDPFEGEGAELEASLHIDAHIRHEDGKWVIYSHDYKKKLGTYDSKEAAEKRLKQIEYFKHQGSMQPLSKKEAVQKEALENQPCDESSCNEPAIQYGPSGVWCAKHKKSSEKDASSEVPMPEDKCEECGKELGPEAFLSKWPVCGKCTKKRHEKALGKHKKADQNISLEQQVQSFRDRMSAVTERLANPPAKTADLETTQDLTNVDVKDLSEGILYMIDMLESKVGENVSANPELHPMLEDLENKVYEVEMKLGIKPELPEHEKLEPEHKDLAKAFGEEPVKESNLEVKADDVNTPPQTLPPAGFRYAWDPKNMNWILVQITGAPGGGQ